MPQVVLFHQPDGTRIKGGSSGGSGALCDDGVTEMGAGGGGGGGGGVLVLIYNSTSWNTETATGGAAGSGDTVSTGTGDNGVAGTAGMILKFQVV